MYERFFVPSCLLQLIHNSLDVESAQILLKGWLDKENAVYIHCRILFSYKKNEILFVFFLQHKEYNWIPLCSDIQPSLKKTNSTLFSLKRGSQCIQQSVKMKWPVWDRFAMFRSCLYPSAIEVLWAVSISMIEYYN